MQIKDLFKKDIARPINGVIQAETDDAGAVWQELDEFVVTQEVDDYLRRFIEQYNQTLERGQDPEVAGQIGVWVSGFFGSGKSHFIKILSHLLKNDSHSQNGSSKKAIEFFESKIEDSMFLADVRKAAASDTDVILFNIDKKSAKDAGRDAILAVFIKVLNELQGYSGDHPHIARLERELRKRGNYQEFKEKFASLSNSTWEAERDGFDFHRDSIVESLVATIGQSKESCEKMLDNSESTYSSQQNIENFANWVLEYLDSKSPEHRLIFLVDEVGQFIGSDTHLMLNLQSITEELGNKCLGRAWVVVTSQEDIDSVLGDMSQRKSNDFSKIKGRFKTKLSLSSRNVDEVLKARLLAKKDSVEQSLKGLYKSKGDILKNQLSFKNNKHTFKQFTDEKEFIESYPFAPYQFELVQKVFEAIRKAGATGQHLSRGERSLIDAFQEAGKQLSNKELGALAPLHVFYPSIENFLEGIVKSTIEKAGENPALKEFDKTLLKVLFLIRYVDEISGNIDNLVTLCLEEIDTDRLSLRKQIEESLQRLESETLVSRSGENYYFLTNEERDIGKEIKNIDLGSGDENKLLAELVFSDVLKDPRDHRYSVTKQDIPFIKNCDGTPYGGARQRGELFVSVVTPLANDYCEFSAGRCVNESVANGGQVIIKLPDDNSLDKEITAFLKTERYLKTREGSDLASTTKRIRSDLAEENRTRRESLTMAVEDMLKEAKYYADGQEVEIKSSAPVTALSESLEYLIRNTFRKMAYLNATYSDEQKRKEAIQALIKSDDIEQQRLKLQEAENNPEAISELRQHISLCTQSSKDIILSELINGKFLKRPYGWPPLETALLLARLYAAGEIQLKKGGGLVGKEKMYDSLVNMRGYEGIQIVQKTAAKAEDLTLARNLGRDVFKESGPDTEDGLAEFLRVKIKESKEALQGYRALIQSGTYPGREEVSEGIGLLTNLLAVDESNKFIERFVENKEELGEFSDAFSDLKQFFENQKSTWDEMLSSLQGFSPNLEQLKAHVEANKALTRLDEIKTAKAPYRLIQEIKPKLEIISQVNKELLNTKRVEVRLALAKQLENTKAELQRAKASEELTNKILAEFSSLGEKVDREISLAHLELSKSKAQGLFDNALSLLAEAAKKSGSSGEKAKAPKIIKASDLMKQSFIETEEQAETYVENLRSELKTALSKGERVQVR